VTRPLATVPCPFCATPLIGDDLATALHPQPLWCAWDAARVPQEPNGREDCDDCGGSESDPCHACATHGERREGLGSVSPMTVLTAYLWRDAAW
jgi:hypothetical protein